MQYSRLGLGLLFLLASISLASPQACSQIPDWNVLFPCSQFCSVHLDSCSAECLDHILLTNDDLISPLVLYTFREGQGAWVLDHSSYPSLPLRFAGEGLSWTIDTTGVGVTMNHLPLPSALLVDDPLRIQNALVASESFSLVVWFRTGSLNSTSVNEPSRIVTISTGIGCYQRAFTAAISWAVTPFPGVRAPLAFRLTALDPPIDEATCTVRSQNPILEPDTLYHLVWSWKREEMNVWLNGGLVELDTNITWNGVLDTSVWLGTSPLGLSLGNEVNCFQNGSGCIPNEGDDSRGFFGTYYYAAIYNHTLTEDQVSDMYDVGPIVYSMNGTRCGPFNTTESEPVVITVPEVGDVTVTLEFEGQAPHYQLSVQEPCEPLRTISVEFETMREKEPNSSVAIQSIDFQNGVLRSNSENSVGFATSLGSGNGNASLVISLYGAAEVISFAGVEFQVYAATNKWSIEMHEWEFVSASNELEIRVNIESEPDAFTSVSIGNETETMIRYHLQTAESVLYTRIIGEKCGRFWGVRHRHSHSIGIGRPIKSLSSKVKRNRRKGRVILNDRTLAFAKGVENDRGDSGGAIDKKSIIETSRGARKKIDRTYMRARRKDIPIWNKSTLFLSD